MKIALNYQDLNNNEISNEKKVKILVEDYNKQINSQNVKVAILDDFKKQGDSFKERLQQRKNRIKEKSRANSPKSKDISIRIDDDESKYESNKLVIDAELINKTLDFQTVVESEDKLENSNTHNILFNVEHENEEKIKRNLELDKIEIVDNIEEEESNEKVNESLDESVSETLFNFFLKKAKLDYKPNTKSKIINETIQPSLESFENEINRYFFSNVFQRFNELIHRIMNERFNKYTETCRIYQNQIKEMEFLVNDDDQHQESINLIIENLKEEKQQELERMEEHYQNVIEEAISNFKFSGLKNNSGIQLIEEKFKLEFFNLVSDVIMPTKK